MVVQISQEPSDTTMHGNTKLLDHFIRSMVGYQAQETTGYKGQKVNGLLLSTAMIGWNLILLINA